MYVYSTAGEPVGFLYETFIYDMGGTPLGRIIGSRVHRFDGSYAGEWYKEMVVDRLRPQPRPMPAIAAPPPRPSPGPSWRRRAVVDYGYPDSFHRLYEGAAAADLGEAAE
jgi:4-fold beta-flower domain-containing protein